MTKRDLEDWNERFKATYRQLMGWCPLTAEQTITERILDGRGGRERVVAERLRRGGWQVASVPINTCDVHARIWIRTQSP